MDAGGNQESASVYKTLYDNVPGFAWRARILGQAPWGGYRLSLEVVSNGCLSIFGIPPEKMLGANTIEQCAHPDDLEYIKQKTSEAIQSHVSVVFCYRILSADRHTIKWIREEARCAYSREDTPLYLEGHIIDVTLEKQQEFLLKQENKRLENLAGKNDGRLGGLIGKSHGMRVLFNRIRLAASSDASVIFYGETGSGKDLAARTLHALSGKKGAFIPVNCGAIPESLMESEFFGHVKGAFSGAVSNHEGFISAADGGTLFLDEIGELPLHLQVKLLRVLENKMYTPVGSSKAKTSDFRLVCATNKNLRELVEIGKMRSDFYYRVHVISINIPPLRERKEDIPQLIHNYFARHGVHHVLSPLTNKRIMEYSWPGNIRELFNFLDRCLVFDDELANPAEHYGAEPITAFSGAVTLADAAASAEKAAIAQALQKCGGRLDQSAELLKTSLSTLKRKIRQYGLTRR
ncbi:MAG: sigma 54-interacting transcriptional regulator [Mailhella sp.]|nr:sigma 54-interacting transcriptional regulator [Mailhella sp.]